MLAPKDREELYGFDPSGRINVELDETDTSAAQAEKVYNALKDDIFVAKLRQLAWKEFCRGSMDGGNSVVNVQTQVRHLMEEGGFKEVISSVAVKTFERSKVLHEKTSCGSSTLHSKARSAEDEKVDCIRKARAAWEQGINEELLAIAVESRRPFILARNGTDTNPLFDVNIMQAPSEGVKFLFDSEDLLETGLAIQNPNMNPIIMDRYMGLLKLNLPVMDLDTAIATFSELSCTEPQLGVDDGHPQYGTRFLTARHDEAKAVIAQGSMLDARVFARRGCPPGLRARIWRRACGLYEEPLPQEEADFLRLRVDCDRLDLLTDELFMHDIQTVLDDPRYFIFDEELKEVVLGFSRDEWVRVNSHYQIHTPLVGKLCPILPESCAMPPCAVQPFLGFATYFAPLCYVFKARPSLYSMARVLFCNLWCRLNVLSSDANTLLSVCKTFECLLLQVHPRLFLHMVNIGLQPLKVAFSWIQLGFVGLLEVDQLLMLWDRVIGYMDLNVFAVAAVAIFVVRAEALLKCTTETEATLVLAEASRLRIIAIMQLLLFKDTRPL